MKGLRFVLGALFGVVTIGTAGCAADTSDELVADTSDEIGFARSGDWTVFPLTTGPNPAAKIDGSVRGFISPEISRTMLLLSVQNLPANRTFGAHLHAASCATNNGGGHYQHVGTTVNEQNEVWLDFKTDASGRAHVLNRKPYAVDPAKAKSVVVHANATDPATGKAGDKLACVDVSFTEGASGTPSAGANCRAAYQCENGSCACSGPKEGTSCSDAASCEKACAVCN